MNTRIWSLSDNLKNVTYTPKIPQAYQHLMTVKTVRFQNFKTTYNLQHNALHSD